MTDTNITTRYEALQEQKAQLEAEARTRRQDLLDELRTICELAGPISADLLDGIVARKRRGPKAGNKKAKKAAPKKDAQVEVTA